MSGEHSRVENGNVGAVHERQAPAVREAVKGVEVQRGVAVEPVSVK